MSPDGFDKSDGSDRSDSVRQESRPLLLAIVGPTATGKSALAVQAALALGGEVVNCDSMQMIRGMDIGTAKPTPEERAAVPHHLYDVIAPDEAYSAGRYMEEARPVCSEIAGRGGTPVVTGGTGLYLRALLEGVFDGPGSAPAIRKRLQRIRERRGGEFLHHLLERRDPVSASRIHPADRVRVIRALEVYFATGTPISALQPRREPLRGFRVLKIGIGLPRALLYERIHRRVERMFHEGLVEETERLLEAGYPADCKGFEALGYRRVVSHLRGDISLHEAIDLTARDTRRYAKRQMTWFRRERRIHWLAVPGQDPGALSVLLGLVSGDGPLSDESDGSDLD